MFLKSVIKFISLYSYRSNNEYEYRINQVVIYLIMSGLRRSQNAKSIVFTIVMSTITTKIKV